MPGIDDNLDGVLAGDRVQVSGVIRRFGVDTIESSVGQIVDERYARFVGEPVIVADAVTPQ